jgi:hypothetical protein
MGVAAPKLCTVRGPMHCATCGTRRLICTDSFLQGTGEPNLMGHASARIAFRYSMLTYAFTESQIEPALDSIYKGGGRSAEQQRLVV